MQKRPTTKETFRASGAGKGKGRGVGVARVRETLKSITGMKGEIGKRGAAKTDEKNDRG